MTIKRDFYVDKLMSVRHNGLVKVVTGVRRCGKSTLLKQFERYLLENGAVEEQIISINFEDISFDYLLEHHALHQYLTERLLDDRKTYIFLDEIPFSLGSL
jgi:predicted AAA+ superfamily ATPase